MSKHALSFVELHGPLFMRGSNLGTKINAAQKNAKLILDDERGLVWIYFKSHVTFIPLANIASSDVESIPADIQAALGITADDTPDLVPPAITKARRGRPPVNQPVEEVVEDAYEPVPMPTHDPNDKVAAAAHLAKVRAASARAHRPNPVDAQNDLLIQQSRATAMGVKFQKTAQVATAQQVGQSAAITGKPKAINHAQLAAQVKAEEKTGI